MPLMMWLTQRARSDKIITPGIVVSDRDLCITGRLIHICIYIYTHAYTSTAEQDNKTWRF